MKIVGILFKADVPTANKTVYTKECIKKIVDRFKPDYLFVIAGDVHVTPNFELEALIFSERVKGRVINLKQDINGDCLYEVEIFFDGKILDVFEDYFSVFPRGRGKLIERSDKRYEVTEYELCNLGICAKEDSAILNSENIGGGVETTMECK